MFFPRINARCRLTSSVTHSRQSGAFRVPGFSWARPRSGMTGLVFTIDGEPITRQRFGHLWRPVVAAAGLPKGTGFHALRHYYASLLIRHGESLKTVQGRLGHASAVETLDTYSHLWPDSDDRTREAIDTVLGAPADSPRTEQA